MPADVVISNVDAPFTNKYLLPPAYARVCTDTITFQYHTRPSQYKSPITNKPTQTQAKDHDTRRFSSSVVNLLFAFDKSYAPALRHHNVFLATGSGNDDAAARESWEGLFTRNKFDPERFNFYVHAPASTDPSVCPRGHDAIMVLVPCPILGPEEAENEAER